MLKNSLAYFSSIATVVITAATFLLAYLTPPLSGPFCRARCFVYPFSDIASRFPRDYYWMYLAIALMVVYLVWVVAISFYAKEDKRIYAQIGLLFAWASGIILLTDYFLQLSIIQPSLLKGESEGIALFTQYNPHGIFIALEDLGYLLMSLGFLFFAFIFSGRNLEKFVRWIFISNFLLSFLSFVWLSIHFGGLREYRFEVASVSINWLTLIITGILLSIIFNNRTKDVSFK